MNRRGFLRGTLSVMALAAVINGTAKKRDSYVTPEEARDYLLSQGPVSQVEILGHHGFEVGDYVTINDEMHRVTSIANNKTVLSPFEKPPVVFGKPRKPINNFKDARKLMRSRGYA